MKTRIGAVPYIYPIPIILAGVNVGGKANFSTLGDVGIMGIKPALVYISVHKEHHSCQGVLDNGCFSINHPNTELLAKTDYCGMVSGKDVDKSSLFTVFYGELEKAPMIEECPVNLECKLVHEFSIQHRQVFVGEVVQTFVSEEFISEVNGQKSISGLKQLNPILYALDNQYYSIGKKIGTGYQEGKKVGKGNV